MSAAKDTSPVLFNINAMPIPVTARDIGMQIACDSADKQASVLLYWQSEVAQYSPRESWDQQCRMIAEHLSDEECRKVGLMLETLTDHLRAIPRERLEERMSATT